MDSMSASKIRFRKSRFSCDLFNAESQAGLHGPPWPQAQLAGEEGGAQEGLGWEWGRVFGESTWELVSDAFNCAKKRGGRQTALHGCL